MLKSTLLAAAAAAVFSSAVAIAQPAPAPTPAPPAAHRPNIIVVLTDDMGYSDIGCYGSEIRTPNLDALASNGLRFTQFYNCARCCPTRASLLTGLYPHQAGIGHMTDSGVVAPGYRGDLNDRCVTIAQVLRGAGYDTAAVGKWHVTPNTGANGPKDNWPLQRGFNRYYGTLHGAGSYYDPSTLVRDNTMMTAFSDPEYKPEQFYYTDAISDHAVKFIEQHRREHSDQPLFMYVAYTAAHWPMQAPRALVEEYKGKYDAGYDVIRRQRFEREKQLGLIDPNWQLSPEAAQWNQVENKAWEARCMEVYAAMVQRMDYGVGRIVSALRQGGELDNTLILYLQDNGGCAEAMGRQGTQERGDKPSLPPMKPEDMQQGSRPRQTRDGWPVLGGTGVMPGPADTYIGYGKAWANVSDTPFREYKHWVHEGGISTPLIAHWPARIARKGQLEREPGHLVDIMATCVDLAAAKYPQELDGKQIRSMEGVSLAPLFDGKALDRPNPIFWEHEGNRAIREGRWKLVAKGAEGRWELYDMQADRTEMHDLAAEQPQRVQEMAAKWDGWAKRADVLPLNPWSRRQQPATPATRPATAARPAVIELKGDAALARGEAPALAGQPLSIEVRISRAGDTGVLLAHGGKALGYSLYIKDGKPVFAVRGGGKLTAVAAAEALPDKPSTVVATLARNGAIKLLVDGREVAHGQAPGALAQTPRDGLEVGRDDNVPVGDYESPNAFKGTIESARLTVGQ